MGLLTKKCLLIIGEKKWCRLRLNQEFIWIAYFQNTHLYIEDSGIEPKLWIMLLPNCVNLTFIGLLPFRVGKD